jgi:hypothetical protein
MFLSEIPEEHKGLRSSENPEEHKMLMFLGSLRNIGAYVPHCHVTEEHMLCSLAPMSTRTYVL